MSETDRAAHVARFGAFEINLHSGELRKHGLKIRLQEQPFQVLGMLLARAGELVTRDDLRKKLWPADTFVDFDHGLNKAINKIRDALGDSAESPRFIETVARRGYRFLAPVEKPPELVLGSLEAKKAINSLAVLPFENRGGDASTEYLSDGVTESIINTLSRLPEIRVIARNTVFRYKGKDSEPAAVGRELGVQAVLTGRVVHKADSLMIGAELVDVENGWQLWGEQYSRKPTDLAAVQEEISREISEKLRLHLSGEDRKRLAIRSTRNAEAYQDYLKGLYHYHRLIEDDLRKSIEYFEQAIRKDPSFALAYTGLANSLSLLAFFSLAAPKEVLPKAKEAARRAVELDDELAEAHASLASLTSYYEWDWPVAEREYQRALQLNPNLASCYAGYANFLLALERTPDAMVQLERAKALDPLSLAFGVQMAWNLYMAREYGSAIAIASKLLETESGFAPAHHALGLASEQAGRHEEAVHAFEKARYGSGGSPASLASLGHALATAGRRKEASAILEEIRGLAKKSYVSPYAFAVMHEALGQNDLAFEALENAFKERDVWLIWLKRDPRLDGLRKDARFDGLVRRVGFPAEGRQASLETSRGARAAQLSPPRIRLAVLPFQNLSADPEQEFFSEGLMDEMISQLAQLSPQRLGVIARTSAMRYKGSSEGIAQIGKQLDLEYVLEGSVRRIKSRVRISVQLIQVKDQTNLWAASYERDLADVFAIQSEVAQSVVRSLAVELLPGAAEPQVKIASTNPAAYEDYLKGRYHWNKFSDEAARKGMQYFEDSIRKDPDYAPSYAGLALCYVELVFLSAASGKQALPKAKEAALKAMRIDDRLAEANGSLAVCSLFHEWNWVAAEEQFKRALGLNPSQALVRHEYSLYLIAMGRLEEAIAEEKQALAFDPLSLLFNTALGRLLYFIRQYDQAIEQCWKSLELDSSFGFAYGILGLAYSQKGRFEEAVSALQKAIILTEGNPTYIASLAQIYALQGRKTEAQRFLDELKKVSKKRFVSAYFVASVWASLGDTTHALEGLRKACDERAFWLIFLNVDPMFDQLRSDKRFQLLLSRIGLPY